MLKPHVTQNVTIRVFGTGDQDATVSQIEETGLRMDTNIFDIVD